MNVSSALGLIDFHTKRTSCFYPWGFAMNGMTSRLEAVRQIIHSLKIEQIVEMGTFRGTTAEWFAQFGLPFETVEISQRYYSFSKRRLKPYVNAEIYRDTSISFLKKRIAQKKTDRNTRQLFYLDSHWEKHLPLREEMELILNNYANVVILIDDFQVDGDPGYCFDAYSETDRLTMSYLSQAKLPDHIQYFYPATRSGDETGMRRGWVVATDNSVMANSLDAIPLLRRAEN
jgi:hypothetical protein